jgi:hypothetical protein
MSSRAAFAYRQSRNVGRALPAHRDKGGIAVRCRKPSISNQSDFAISGLLAVETNFESRVSEAASASAAKDGSWKWSGSAHCRAIATVPFEKCAGLNEFTFH